MYREALSLCHGKHRYDFIHCCVVEDEIGMHILLPGQVAPLDPKGFPQACSYSKDSVRLGIGLVLLFVAQSLLVVLSYSRRTLFVYSPRASRQLSSF